VLAFVGTGALRAIYPYPIDGIEPGALQEVRRVIAGRPLYVAPTLDYVPFIYGPLYFYLAAPVAALLGSELLGLRTVSVLASLGSLTLVALLVQRETGSWAMGLVGSGLLAASAPQVGALDVGRMDALQLSLLLAAVWAARRACLEPGAGWRSAAACGGLMGLALLTKQSGTPLAVALLIALVLGRRDLVPAFVLALGATLGGALLLLVAQSGRWPLFYLWELPRRHDIRLELLPRFWDHLLARFTLPLVLGLLYPIGRFQDGDRSRGVFYTTVSLGMLATAWAAQSTVGGGRNVELPAFAMLSILFALELHQARGLAGSYGIAIALAQFAILVYNPRLVVPYRSDMWDGDRLTETLGAMPGPIFAGSYHGFLRQAPDAVAPDLGAMLELQGAFGGVQTPEGEQWASQYVAALQERRFTYLIVDPDVNAPMVVNLATELGYQHVGPLFPPNDVYWLWRTGWSPRAEVYARPQ
jgi:hypothetical protein